MHITDIHVVVGQAKDGSVKQLYIGRDAAKASEVYYGAKDYTEVGLQSYPPFTSRRYPIDEQALTDSAKESSYQIAEAAKAKKIADATAKRTHAQKLLEEAEKLHPTATPETQPSASSPTSPDSEAVASGTDPVAAEEATAPVEKKSRKQK